MAPAGPPTVDLPPWTAAQVRSASNGSVYDYQHIAGPDEGAPALLMLPGGFFDNRIWHHMSSLADVYSLYALHWPAESPYYGGQLSDFGDLTADFLRAARIDEFHMAGVSFGTYAAIDLASRRPDLGPEALFLFSAVMLGEDRHEVRWRKALSRVGLGLPHWLFGPLLWIRMRLAGFGEAPGDLQQRDIFWVRQPRYYQQLLGALGAQRGKRQRTDQVACPTLLLAGSEDGIMPIEAARKAPAAFSDAELLEFEGYGHSMVFEHGPEMVEAMRSFLERRGLATRRYAQPG